MYNHDMLQSKYENSDLKTYRSVDETNGNMGQHQIRRIINAPKSYFGQKGIISECT